VITPDKVNEQVATRGIRIAKVGREVLRKALLFYVRHSPIQRGKGRLVHELRPWLRIRGESATATTLFGCTMELDLFDHVQAWIYFFGSYESPLVDYFTGALSAGMVFADIGAQVGQFTLLASKLVGDKGHVHAFEPSPKTVRLLQRNMLLNGFTNITVHEMALADTACEAELYLPKGDSLGTNIGSNSLRPRESWKETAAVSVAVQRLDDVFREQTRLDVIKIDVEGAELSVIRGARETILRFRPVIAFEAEESNTSAFGYTTCDLKKEIEALGYDLFRLTGVRGGFELCRTQSSEPEESSSVIAAPRLDR